MHNVPYLFIDAVLFHGYRSIDTQRHLSKLAKNSLWAIASKNKNESAKDDITKMVAFFNPTSLQFSFKATLSSGSEISSFSELRNHKFNSNGQVFIYQAHIANGIEVPFSDFFDKILLPLGADELIFNSVQCPSFIGLFLQALTIRDYVIPRIRFWYCNIDWFCHGFLDHLSFLADSKLLRLLIFVNNARKDVSNPRALRILEQLLLMRNAP